MGGAPQCPPLLWEILPSVCHFNVFLRSCRLVFIDFFSWSCIILSSKNWQSLIFAKDSFLLIFGLRGLQNRAYCIFLKLCHWIFLRAACFQAAERRIIMTLDFPPQIQCLLKFQLLNYCPRCSQLIRLQHSRKSKSLSLGFLYVSEKTVGLWMAWMDMPKLFQND